MKKLLFLALIFGAIAANAQTWQYSLSDDQLGFRDKLGNGEQKVDLVIKSFDGKEMLHETISITSDDWKYIHLHEAYPKVFNANQTYLLKVTLKQGNADLIEVDYAYNSYVKEAEVKIKRKDLPDFIESRLVGEFVEGTMYRNEQGINYYVGQRLQDDSKPLVEWIYTISEYGKITEHEIKR